MAEWKLAVDKDRGGKAKGNAKVMSERTSYSEYVWELVIYALVEMCPNDINVSPQKKKGSKSGKKKKKEKDLTADR